MVYRRLIDRQSEQQLAALKRDWMTLVEAIDVVKQLDAESAIKVEPSPYQQICDAIEDGELRARWLDEASPPRFGFPPGVAWIPDKPDNYALRKRKVRLENGGEIHWGRRRWRKLLLFREDMKRVFSATDGLRRLWNNEQGRQTMHEAISAIYDLAEAQGVKPPNVVEMREVACRWLAKHKGVSVHGLWIEQLASDPRYDARRVKPGATLKGRLRPVSELEI
jgi:hypothetical protein